MTKKRIIIVTILLLLAVVGYFLFSGEEPIILDTTLDKYQTTLDVSKKCTASAKPSDVTCKKVVKALESQIQKILAAPTGKKRFKKQLIELYRAEEKAQLKLNQIQSAININLKIIQLDPQSAHHYSRLSGRYQEIGAKKEAVKYARLAAQLAPFIWRSHNTLAEALALNGQYAEADAAYAKAIELASSQSIPALEEARKDLLIKQTLIIKE